MLGGVGCREVFSYLVRTAGWTLRGLVLKSGRRERAGALCLASLLGGGGLGACGLNQRHIVSEGSQVQPTEASSVANVFGRDERVDTLSRFFPWSSLGTLDSGCSATLVGKRLVLTAAHCVFDSLAQRVIPELHFFYPNVVKGLSALAPVAIESLWYGSQQPERERGRDWALLSLAKPLGARLGFMPVVALDFASHLPFAVNLAGYSKDRHGGASLSVHWNCHIRRIVVGGRHLHDCDAASGASGGPLFRLVPSRGAFVVGLMVSEYRRGAADSLWRPEYEDFYANVAIAATAFKAVWDVLRQSVDEGRPLPPGRLPASIPVHVGHLGKAASAAGASLEGR